MGRWSVYPDGKLETEGAASPFQEGLHPYSTHHMVSTAIPLLGHLVSCPMTGVLQKGCERDKPL
jgi:hypothetical protein